MSAFWKILLQRRAKRALELHGIHARAMRRQLTWAREFALTGDLASAVDALGDAGALAQELGRRPDGSALAEL